MPFTLAHPAAVLPLVRTPLSTVALVAGAVAPDLPYFVGSVGIAASAQSWYEPFLNATTAHSPRGMLTVDLAYALALYWLARAVRRPVGTLLPGLASARRRHGDGARGSPARAWWVLVSLLSGITTHLVWDSFTHADGYVVDHVSWLTSSLAGELTWARALQHASTVVGLAAIGVYAWRRRSRLSPGPIGRRRRLVLLGVLGAVVVGGAGASAASGWAGAAGLSTGRLVEVVLSDGAKGGGGAFLGALVLYTAAWWVHHVTVSARPRRADAPRT